jgi:flavin-dependent dehydrogenase
MDVDVAIIGGGPAGCAAALALRSRGLSVTVISSPTRREKPTETALPSLPRLLQSLDASEAMGSCEPCYGIVSAWGRTTPILQPSMMNPFGHAWFVHRAQFDSCLQNAARGKGATWLAEEAQAVHFNSHGGSVVVAETTVRARWIIFATGSPSWPARITQQKTTKTDSMLAFWARIPMSLQERLLFVEPTDFGWWYVCPAESAGAIACFVTDPLSARTLGPSQPAAWNHLFQATTLSQQLQGEPAEQVHIALTGLASLPEKHGPYWIAVGDAAVKLDPLGSSGTATALDSGLRAAHAVADALLGNGTDLDRYGRWSTGLVEEFTRQRRQQYAIEGLTRKDGFWPRRLAHALEGGPNEGLHQRIDD